MAQSGRADDFQGPPSSTLRELASVEVEAVSVLDNHYRLAKCPDEAPSAAGTIA